MLTSRKYCRSLHARCSLGTTSDDRLMPPGYVAAFAQLPELILSEKLDGQNNCLTRHGVFARSHAAPSQHPWDAPLRARWELLRRDLGSLEVFGENMYGVHSIAYRKLDSYFYVFAVRDGEQWLSWEEVTHYAALLDFPTVPTIAFAKPLRDYLPSGDEDSALEAWLHTALGEPWTTATNGPGQLGGYDPSTGAPCCEGFVVRNAASFATNAGLLPVAANEFDSLFKLVRARHVKTDVHWTKTWTPATLSNYARYGWHAYQYLSR